MAVHVCLALGGALAGLLIGFFLRGDGYLDLRHMLNTLCREAMGPWRAQMERNRDLGIVEEELPIPLFAQKVSEVADALEARFGVPATCDGDGRKRFLRSDNPTGQQRRGIAMGMEHPW